MARESKQLPKWRRWLKEEDLGKRLLIGVVISLSIASFIHFREIRIDSLEIDTKAKDYVVAQVDFEFPDEEGTIVMRQESSRDVGAIYNINAKEVEQRRFTFENYLIHNPKWRGLFPSHTFEEMYQGADAVKNALVEARFTDARPLT